jgi:hypothetical protein
MSWSISLAIGVVTRNKQLQQFLQCEYIYTWCILDEETEKVARGTKERP